MGTRTRKPSLSVIFPAFNEEANVAASVEGVRAVLCRHFDEFEIIVVDDGSTDRTRALAEELAARYPEVRVLRHDRNYKLGRTLRTGLAAATKELVFYTDADLPIDFREIPRGVELLLHNGVQVVTGYRLSRSERWWRTVYTVGYNALVDVVFGLRLRDVNFSYKLFQAEALRQLKLTSEGSFIDVEILARARRAGMIIDEIGVQYFPRRAGRSTLARPGVIVKIIREMAAFWWRVWLPGPRAASFDRPETP
jgi:glycosyltransferase involved in cell wall biosynthesis